MYQALISIRLALGLLFTASAIGKLLNVRAFLRGVQEYHILSGRSTVFFGALLIPSELAVGVAHLSGLFLFLGAPLGALLLSVFALAVSRSLASGRIIPCYCMGAYDPEFVSRRSLAKIAIALAAELAVIIALILHLWPVEKGFNLPFFALLVAFVSALFLLQITAWALRAVDVTYFIFKYIHHLLRGREEGASV